MDGIIVAVTTIVAIVTSLYLFALSRVQFLKKNWVEYRCNPLYMPMAGLVGDSVVTNFTKCTMKGFQDYAGFVMDPLMGEFAVVNETLDEVGGAMNSMRSMMSGVRGGFLGIIGSVFGKIQNLMSQFQYIIIRMRTLLSRIVGVMLSFIYVFYTGMDTGESVMNGPIGETVSFLCFDPDTMVLLKGNRAVPMFTLVAGDVLYTGETITSTYRIDGNGVEMYHLSGVVVSGNHKVMYNDQAIKVKEHPEAFELPTKLPYLICFNTDKHTITLRGTQFLDFIESDKPLTSYPPETRIVLNDKTTRSISQIMIGTMLEHSNRVIGVVHHGKNYQLITESHSFTIRIPMGTIKTVSDEIANTVF